MDILRECKNRGWQLLNEKPILDIEEEEACIRHGDEGERILNEMEAFADAERGLWVVKRHYIDVAHEGIRTRYRFVKPFDLWEMVECADFKNGVDTCISQDGKALVLIANGQGYMRSDGVHGIVTAVFECRLLDRRAAEAVREILEVASEYDRTYKTEEIEAARAFFGECLPLR